MLSLEEIRGLSAMNPELEKVSCQLMSRFPPPETPHRADNCGPDVPR